MSAIAIIRADSAVVLAADGAAYDGETGVLIGHATKIIPLVHIDCVLAFVGAGAFGIYLQHAVGQDFTSFDELLDQIVERARVGAETMIWEGHPFIRATLAIAGWSESRARFETYKIHTGQRDGINPETGETIIFEPFELHPMNQIWTSNWPGDDLCEKVGLAFDGEFSALDMAAKLVCASRLQSGPSGDHDGVYGVGCFLQMSVLTKGQIKSWIAHRWPDPIGEVIDPQRGEVLPKFPILVP